ncbi:MAG: hypothetical protein A2505_03770 [Deltaproteobacteria bacterium RIFOXYD12_FULL_55_16]|nr:MAG: hypothetical protein A2505_03770 [Deltaproteobacteria bacterium RIFOXYD12_FULL_55_16]
MNSPDNAGQLRKKISILQQKVHLLETMVEDRTREAYLEQERLSALIAILRHCHAATDLQTLLTGCLDLLLDRDFLRSTHQGAVFMVHRPEELALMAARNLRPETALHPCATIPFGHCLCGRAAVEGRLIFAHNTEENEHGHATFAPHSHYCVPITVQGQTSALLLLYVSSHVQQDQEETRFLEAAAEAVGAAILRLNYLTKLDRDQAHLEELIKVRTFGLQQAEARYRGLFENALEGIFQTSLTGKILTCNPAFARMLGYDSSAEIINKVHDLAHDLYVNPADRDRLLQLLQAKGKVYGFVVRLRRQDGSLIWAESHCRLIQTANTAEPLVEGMTINITRRREAEESLATEKERLAVTLQSIGDGVICTDIEGRITLLNMVTESLTGWSDDEARGRPFAEVFQIINELSRQPVENPVARVLREGITVGLANHTILISRSGREYVISNSAAPIRCHTGDILGVVLVFRDVTSQQRMEAEIQKIEKLESVGVLAGGIAHDFNNILTVVMGNLSLALRLTNPDDQRYDLLASAGKAADRARKLTGQLLSFAKGGEPVREAAAIDEVIRESAAFILHGSSCSYSLEYPDDLWQISFDRGQISQVIQNLVLNASQAMPAGGAIRINCRNREIGPDSALPLPAGRYLSICVRDSGTGIPADRLGRIFDPYFTTKEAGSGLGLAITHSIVKKHGGHIKAASILGEGASFTMFLPVDQEEPKTKAAVQSGLEGQASGRILIMDDEEVVRKTCSAILDYLGYQAAEAADGREAIALYRAALETAAPFAAVIMDLTIPNGMGGIEAALELRQADPQAILLASSGYSHDQAMADCHAYGFNGAIGKPYQVNELASALRLALGEQLPRSRQSEFRSQHEEAKDNIILNSES